MKEQYPHLATSSLHVISSLESLLIMLFLAAIPAALGYIIIGENGLLLGFTISLFILGTLPHLPPSTVMSSYRAQLLTQNQHPELFYCVSLLADKAGLTSTPDVYLLPSSNLQAFTFGNEHESAIGISHGLLTNLTLGELSGVLAHEIGHIKSHDTRIMMTANIAQLITEQFSFLGKILFVLWIPVFAIQGNIVSGIPIFLFVILSPIITALLRSSLSRTREFNADIFSAELTNNPLQLASALIKMDNLQRGLIANIFHLRRQSATNLLSTHPDTQVRIDRLIALSEQSTKY